MSPRCIKCLVLLSWLVLPGLCIGQVNSFQKEYPFLKHLAREKLYEERLFVLNNVPDSIPSITYYLEKAWTFHALGRYDSALHLYTDRTPDSVLVSRFRDDYFNLLFKMRQL